MGRLMAMAINESANQCNPNGEKDPMPCCEDITEEMKVEEVTQTSFDFDSTPDLYQIAAIIFVLDQSGLKLEEDKVHFQLYSPPPPDEDVQTEHQVFLI